MFYGLAHQILTGNNLTIFFTILQNISEFGVDVLILLIDYTAKMRARDGTLTDLGTGSAFPILLLDKQTRIDSYALTLDSCRQPNLTLLTAYICEAL